MLSFDFHDFGILEGNGICPEWVRMERLYNCDNFYQTLHSHQSFFKRWFRKKH
ncbi:MAG: hypothetical protein ACLSX5_04510 [Lachnospiraceae bacterium]